MTPDQALEEAKAGTLRPVYLVWGSERFLHDAVLKALRDAATRGGIPGLNDDQLVAGEHSADAAIAAARTLPMMGDRRLVFVRHIDRWEKSAKSGKGGNDLDRMLDYATNPADTTVMLLSSATLDKRRKLFTQAKKEGWLVECEPPKTHELPGWVMRAVRERGNKISAGVAEFIAAIGGTDLAQLDDAVERVCLYVGSGNEVTEAAVGECVVRLSSASAFELVDAVARRDISACIKTLADVYDPDDRGLRLVGLLSWSARQLLGFSAARRQGQSPADAAKTAGAPPFKAKDLDAQIRRIRPRDLEAWLSTLAEVDRALKGGSARPPRAVLEEAIIGMCTSNSA
ncbi:MAG: DNA polymerase III subunit delta [Polyangiaceae bacterium]